MRWRQYPIVVGAYASLLPARRLVKTRWAVAVEGPEATGSVNVFEEDLAGLVLLEVDTARPREGRRGQGRGNGSGSAKRRSTLVVIWATSLS